MRLNEYQPRAFLSESSGAVVIEPPSEREPWVTVRARSRDVDAGAWLASNKLAVHTLLEEHSAVLLRGFSAATHDELRSLVIAFDGEPLSYHERSTPRSSLGGGLYTSTEYPAYETITLHSEFSYGNHWPAHLWFHCVVPAERGGETLLASTQAVHDEIDPAVRERFSQLGVRYVRHYGSGVDLSWQEAYQTDDPAAVEAYCYREHIGFEWGGRGTLRTWQDRSAILMHPRSGRSLWFNQAHLFHPSGLPAAVREGLLLAGHGTTWPRDAQFSDGTPIPEDDLAEVRRAMAVCTTGIVWKAGDTLVIDNMALAHGRARFTGSRRVLVMMTSTVHRYTAT